MIRAATGNVLGLLLLAFALLPAGAEASVGVTARLAPDRVAVGEAFRLEVTVQSTGLAGAGDVVVPSHPALRNVGRASNQTMRFVNGAVTRELIETFTFVAREPGRYRFDGVGVKRGNQFVAAPVVSIQVDAAGASQGSPGVAGPGGGAPEPALSGELPPPGRDLYVTAFVDRDRVWQGEPIVYTFRFFFYRLAPDNPTYDTPDFAGFEAFDLGQSDEPQTVMVHGRPYQYFDIRTLLYPVRSGELVIDPAALSFRGNFFFARDQVLRAKPIRVQVRPLPEGAPADFGGAVGSFALRAGRLPARVHADEPVTLSLSVAGIGNFRRVGAPAPVTEAGWRIYPGRVSEDTRAGDAGMSGEKQFELLLLPPGPGRQQMPTFAFSYFEPAVEAYRTLRITPGEVEILAQPGAGAPTRTLRSLSFRPLRTEPGPAPADPLTPWRLFAWLLPLPLVGLVLLQAGSAVRRRMREATPEDRRTAARRKLEREVNSADSDPLVLLRAMDQWLHEAHGLGAAPAEADVRAALGDQADGFLEARRRLQQAVYGGGGDAHGARRVLREWLRKGGTALALVLALGGIGTAAATDTLFQRAQQAHMEGNYGESVRLYQRAAEQLLPRVNILYNLSGAAWRAGDPALARYAIERAYSLAPRDADVAANRRLIGEAVADMGGSAGAAVPGLMTFGEAGWLTAGLFVLFTATLLVARFGPRLRWTAAVLFLLTLAAGIHGAWLYGRLNDAQPGVLWRETALHEAADERSGTVTLLPAGDLAWIEQAGGAWLQVRTPRGLRGWLPAEAWRPLPVLSPREGIPE